MDREEFAVLTAGQADRLRLLARRLARQGQDPDDLLQDTLESAWRSYDKLHDREAVGAWLRTIMVNRVRDQGRRAGLLVSPRCRRSPSPRMWSLKIRSR